MSAELPISLADIKAAARRIAGQAVETPLLESQELARMTGGRVFIKPEMLQRTGSFKFRGAFNRLSQLSPHERRRGVVAFSSGNHGQAIAAAAAVLGIAAVVVMPSNAPSVKIERTRGFGAQIVLFDRRRDDRAAIAQKLADERGLVLVPPYDDYDVMAGQGTVGLEIAGQALRRNAKPDFVLVPCSGGGLLAGIAVAIKALCVDAEVIAVEPSDYDDTARSLAAGQPVDHPPAPPSICDSLLSPRPGALTFPVNRRLVRRGLPASDAEVALAMRFALDQLRLVAEPGGVVTLAALMQGALRREIRRLSWSSREAMRARPC